MAEQLNVPINKDNIAEYSIRNMSQEEAFRWGGWYQPVEGGSTNYQPSDEMSREWVNKDTQLLETIDKLDVINEDLEIFQNKINEHSDTLEDHENRITKNKEDIDTLFDEVEKLKARVTKNEEDIAALQTRVGGQAPVYGSGNPNTNELESAEFIYFDMDTSPPSQYINENSGVTTGWILTNPQP